MLPGRSALRLAPVHVLVAGALGAWAVANAQNGDHAGDATRFLLAIAAILVAAKIGGEIFERIGQPAVLGELVMGIVLGNASLAGLGAFEPLQDAPFVAIAAEIGVILLLFQVGLESDLNELLAVGPSALVVALLGVATPLALGYFVSSAFMTEDAQPYVHLFVGATLSATSVGITARVLKDIGKTETRESRVILGAAIVDDILGLLLLAFVFGLLRSADAGDPMGFEWLPILVILGKALGFLAGSFLVSRWAVEGMLAILQYAKSKSVGFVLGLAFCFLMAALAELVGLANVVGAFAAGLVLESSLAHRFGARLIRHRLDRSVEPIAAIFVPVFFVHMGLRVDLASFAYGDVLVFVAVLSAVAIASKQVCSLGVLEKGLNRLAIGVGMIPRGEVGLIFAGVGSGVMVAGAPVFSTETYSVVVATVILTTLVTPPLLKAAFARTPPQPAVQQPSLFPEMEATDAKSQVRRAS